MNLLETTHNIQAVDVIEYKHNTQPIDIIKDVYGIEKADFFQDAYTIPYTITLTDVIEDIYTIQAADIIEITDTIQEAGIADVIQDVDTIQKVDDIQDIDVMQTTDGNDVTNTLSLFYDQVIPDDNDPEYYCRVCKTNSATRGAYYEHLTKDHGMILMPFSHWRNNKPDLDGPDVDESNVDKLNADGPNWYCKVCQRKYSSRQYYHKHIERFHNIKLEHKVEKYKPPVYRGNL